MKIFIICIFITVILIMSLYWHMSIRAFKNNDDSCGIMYGIPLTLMSIVINTIIMVQLCNWRL